MVQTDRTVAVERQAAFARELARVPGEGRPVIAPIGHRDAASRTLMAPDAALPATVREHVLLLVTELVNHAVRDGGGDAERSLRVNLRMQPRQVRVELVEPAPAVGPVESRARGKAGRWALFLAKQIADRWGVSRAGPGTCVWFEIEFER